jgi:histidyl-tRNA synthetase
MKNNSVTIKNMQSGEQKNISVTELAEYLKGNF